MNIRPSLKEFQELSGKYSHVTLSLEITGDMETPVSLYSKIRNISSYSFLLESALQSGSSGRYSFIGFNPEKVITCKNGALSVREQDKVYNIDREPFDYFRNLLNKYTIPHIPGLPGFTGGLVGYFGYDIIRLIEHIPDRHPNDQQIDDLCVMLVKTVLIYDHYHHTMYLTALTDCGDNVEYSYQKGCAQLESIVRVLEKPLNNTQPAPDKRDENLPISSNVTKDEFIRTVRKAREYIANGDIFQIVLSQRFSVPVSADAFNIYRRLRQINPSPYMFYLTLDDLVVTGSSPEVLVKSLDGSVTARPLAGTRRRAASTVEDHRMALELLSDEKECAEHVMLVDLGRNDLGKFCKYGSIQVPEFLEIERYSHVMHIVSEVTGQLADGKDSIDVFKGSFPAGTVSGAPKIRAMELIDQLEQTRRGIYSGAVGYFDFHDNMDTCITIRTIVIKNGTAYIQAGAGIVADSEPEKEFDETINKAHVLIKAIASSEGKSYDLDY